MLSRHAWSFALTLYTSPYSLQCLCVLIVISFLDFFFVCMYVHVYLLHHSSVMEGGTGGFRLSPSSPPPFLLLSLSPLSLPIFSLPLSFLQSPSPTPWVLTEIAFVFLLLYAFSVYAKSSEALPDNCQTDWIFCRRNFAGQKKYSASVYNVSTDFNHQFAKNTCFNVFWFKEKMKMKSPFKCFYLSCFFFRVNSVKLRSRSMAIQNSFPWFGLIGFAAYGLFGFAANILRK